LATQEVITTKVMSNNEDIDYEKTITELISQESVHRAALGVGARIIQPTLVDFLR
jgi:flagellar hook-associated protein 3 FlgL